MGAPRASLFRRLRRHPDERPDDAIHAGHEHLRHRLDVAEPPTPSGPLTLRLPRVTEQSHREATTPPPRPKGCAGKTGRVCGRIDEAFRESKPDGVCLGAGGARGGGLGVRLRLRLRLRGVRRRRRRFGEQLRRAASSVVLNLAEGSGSVGGMRTARYRTALGSARETMSCLLVAERFGYVEAMPAVLAADMNRVIGTLVRVAV